MYELYNQTKHLDSVFDICLDVFSGPGHYAVELYWVGACRGAILHAWGTGSITKEVYDLLSQTLAHWEHLAWKKGEEA